MKFSKQNLQTLVSALVWLCACSAFAGTFTEDFGDSPFTGDGGDFMIEGPGTDQFEFLPAAPVAFSGDPVGALAVHFDSLRQSTRFRAPVGVAVTETDSFSLGGIMTIQGSGFNADPNGFMQIAFGLINSSTTGLDRTGDFSDFAADTFDMVEFDYFPNASALFGGPFVSQLVLGEAVGGDAFNNVAFSSGEFALPLDTPLRIELHYDGMTSVLTLMVDQIAVNGSLTPLATGVKPLDIFAPPGGFAVPIEGGFTVDTIAISAYFDGFTAGTPSVEGTIVFDLLFAAFPDDEALTCAQAADRVFDQLCQDTSGAGLSSLSGLSALAAALAPTVLGRVDLIDEGTPESASTEACIDHILQLVRDLITSISGG